MKLSIDKSEIAGRLSIPSSKSYTIRALMCAALADGESEILNPLISDDTQAAADVLRKIGVEVVQNEGIWRVNGGDLRPSTSELYCGDSAATLRFMTAICALVPGESVLTAGDSLSKRPIQPLADALSKLGVNIRCEAGSPPVTVTGGRLKGGHTAIAGNISSQFISALLLVAPRAEKGLNIRLTKPLESKPYIMMTLLCLRKFGIEVAKLLDRFLVKRQVYQPAKYEVEGDWSSASYFMALGALSGSVVLENLSSASWQGDRIIMDYLRDMGAQVQVSGNTITVSKSKLAPITADLSDSIDLLPTMAMLAAAAPGGSVFTGIERARLKESNRVSAMEEGLRSMGVEIAVERNRITIIGGQPHGGKIDSKGDHRIAMAFGVLGAFTGDTVIDGAECVSKTYPRFWDALKSVGGEVSVNVK